MEIIINHSKDPYYPTSIMESKAGIHFCLELRWSHWRVTRPKIHEPPMPESGFVGRFFPSFFGSGFVSFCGWMKLMKLMCNSKLTDMIRKQVR